MNESELERVVRLESTALSNIKRIDKLEKANEALLELATSIKIMAVKQDTLVDKIDTIDTKVNVLESIPRNRWNSIVEKMIITVVGAIIGYLITKGGF